MWCDSYLTDAFAIGVAAYSLFVGGYPWSNTEPWWCETGCRAFGFHCVNGFIALTWRRKVVGLQHVVAEMVSAPVLDMLGGLLDVNAATRATLGERAWLETWGETGRTT